MSRARLILEHAPTAQAKTEVVYHGGQLSVGRGDDADWCISDPDKFVSRKHFVLSEEAGSIMVTDASTGGLFVDGGSSALGVGNSQVLDDGMRLRFGDFVLRVEMETTIDAGPDTNSKKSSGLEFSFDPVDEPPKQKDRPEGLPEPFGVQGSSFFGEAKAKEEKPLEPLDREDPFALDLKPSTPHGARSSKGSERLDSAPASERAPRHDTRERKRRDTGGGNYFGTASSAPKVEKSNIEPTPPSAPDKETPVPPAIEADLRDAFFRGLGVDPSKFAPSNQLEEMEALGRRFRALTDGLLHLLRNRAAEKQKSRVAQTIIGAANVNPLKFAVSTDDAVSNLIAERGAGYLDPDTAITDGFSDLIDHQMRTWTALQTALRQMIDKFDPAEIEKEMEGTGLLEALISGGRSAKLWQLYEERYREIACAAEERFLGEIGSDFREAYETNGR